MHGADLAVTSPYAAGRRNAIDLVDRQCADAYGSVELDQALTDASGHGGASSYLDPGYFEFESAVRAHAKPQEVARLAARLALDHPDGQVIDAIDATLVNYGYSISFPGTAFQSTLGHLPDGQMELFLLALALMQCDRGAPCGPYSMRVLQYCLTRPVCEPSLGLEAEVDGLLLSRIEFDDLLLIRAQLDALARR